MKNDVERELKNNRKRYQRMGAIQNKTEATILTVPFPLLEYLSHLEILARLLCLNPRK